MEGMEGSNKPDWDSLRESLGGSGGDRGSEDGSGDTREGYQGVDSPVPSEPAPWSKGIKVDKPVDATEQDKEAGSEEAGRGGSDPGSDPGGDSGIDEESLLGDPASQGYEQRRRKLYTDRAKHWLRGGKSRVEMLEFIRLNLIINYQFEVAEGTNLREYQKSGPSMARQARKQSKETAELIMTITEELEKGGLKK